MKKPISKAQIREQLSRQVESYLNQGGAVEQIQRGVSGRDAADGPIKTHEFTERPKPSRTYLPEVIAAIDARKQKKTAVKKTARRPRKRIIYDDFGEPLRWEWVEE